jgi:hypothetical protein
MGRKDPIKLSVPAVSVSEEAGWQIGLSLVSVEATLARRATKKGDVFRARNRHLRVIRF